MAIAKIVITIIYIIAALAIIAVVLMQEGKSAGLGSIGGASSSSGSSYWDKNKKHSLEGKFERWTKLTAALFVILALVLMVI
jgi:preprotein translocase subunit SecG